MLTNLLNRTQLSGILICISFMLGCNLLCAQDVEIDSLGFETFKMIEEDTSYTMKKYYIVYFKTGPNREQASEEAAKIQAGHRANMRLLADQGALCIAGPMGDDGDIRGIMILSIPTIDEVQAIVAKDPAVMAGRLIMEIQPFWAAKGSTLF